MVNFSSVERRAVNGQTALDVNLGLGPEDNALVLVSRYVSGRKIRQYFLATLTNEVDGSVKEVL